MRGLLFGKPSAEQRERECECGNILTVDKDGTQSGWYCCEQYFCSEPCLSASFEGSGTTWEEHYNDEGECYWTEWESEERAPVCPVDPAEAVACDACQ